MRRKNKHIDIYKHLNQEELIDYHNGILGNTEMYRLELHLNECELCTDALEGLAYSNNPEKTLSYIRNAILPAKNKSSRFNYMAVAASIALVAVSGISYWLLNSSNEDQKIALITTVEQEIVGKKIESYKEETPLANEAEQVADQIEESENELIDHDPIDVKSESLTLATHDEEIQKDLNIPETTKIVSKKIDQVAETEVFENMLEDQIELDLKEEKQKQEAFLKPSVTDKGVAIQSKPSAETTAKKTTRQTTVILKDKKNPAPKGGMEALKNHIEKNLNYPDQAKNNNIKGTVVLEVTISSDGSIKNIIVIKSVGYGCDIEAMRLVSVGPKWLAAVLNGEPIEAKREVKVKFKN